MMKWQGRVDEMFYLFVQYYCGNMLCLFHRDIMSIYNEPPPGMCIVPDKDDITKVRFTVLTVHLFLPSGYY